jgi:hypothetical protein
MHQPVQRLRLCLHFEKKKIEIWTRESCMGVNLAWTFSALSFWLGGEAKVHLFGGVF